MNSLTSCTGGTSSAEHLAEGHLSSGQQTGTSAKGSHHSLKHCTIATDPYYCLSSSDNGTMEVVTTAQHILTPQLGEATIDSEAKLGLQEDSNSDTYMQVPCTITQSKATEYQTGIPSQASNQTDRMEGQKVSSDNTCTASTEGAMKPTCTANDSSFINTTKQVSNISARSLRFKPQLREYQKELAEGGVRGRSYIICAPTGSGKTVVASYIIAEHLQKRWRKGRPAKVVFFANLVPLVQQQCRMIAEYIEGIRICKLFGEMRQGMDASTNKSVGSLLEENDIVVCTDGVLEQDLEQKRVRCEDVTLLIMDECHRALPSTQSGTSSYGKIMIHFLRCKQNGTTIPQIVGLTASPGTGSKEPTKDSLSAHVNRLCAHVNAIDGLKVVKQHSEELQQHCHAATQLVEATDSHLELDHLASEIKEVMREIEMKFSWKFEHPNAKPYVSIEYSQWADALKNTLQQANEVPEAIMAAEHLEGYSKALNIFKDLNAKECLLQLESDEMLGSLPSAEQASGYQIVLRNHLMRLIDLAKEYKETSSANLDRLEHVLLRAHKDNDKCKAIVFVPRKHYAYFLSDWITGNKALSMFSPSVCVGQTGPDEYRMTASQQDEAIQKLRTGEANVLVGTALLEEGLDIPDCDCSIRYGYVKNDISRTQAQGRARKAGSTCITIVSKGSSKEQREETNKKRVEFFQQYVKEAKLVDLCDPQSIQMLQREIVSAADSKSVVLNQVKSKYKPEDVDLVCTRCNHLICKGTEIFLFGHSYRIALRQGFKCEIDSSSGQKGGKTVDGIKSFGKLSCTCGAVWGRIGQPVQEEKVFLPIISAPIRLRLPDGSYHEYETYKRWKNVPFYERKFSEADAPNIEQFSLPMQQ